MALRAVVQKAKPVAKETQRVNCIPLYRAMLRELPRVLVIYDIDMPIRKATAAVEKHFRQNADVKDPRVLSILLGKGYMELEETLFQWKQKSHLMDRLEPVEMASAEDVTAAERACLGKDYKFE
mmetsp:Transcript_2589/g.3920  ORF Transcript_2589/g.3920 Transcript_2589/m.3920 type:complete len:124 (+) Transcript_2589:70-441(+)|eukprot:CAMPEP_0185024018 /NCGR_PEP_ID=MMETSP1103-20130426/6891_1 /TAXON_ID=36769 /ORGANISM="Paraphysomonas bandaiensis, Strain Caron Lab Isolate" /LENGTH=123 /DNA_ID=CAMNT_0027556853 /DNA_START=55 /DNA_END=426 /DNA_ORIENTATION=+